MGTIVYKSLLKLFLDEGDYSLDEIIDIAEERYDYFGKHFEMEMRLALGLTKITRPNAIEELSEGKLHKKEDFCSNLNLMLGGPDRLPEGHYDRINPKRRQFLIDLEQRYGRIYQKEELTQKSINDKLDDDIPF